MPKILKISHMSYLILNLRIVFLMYMPVANAVELSGPCFLISLKFAENSHLKLRHETVFFDYTEAGLRSGY